MKAYKQDETFDNIDYTQNHLPKGEYENCIFTACLFSEADLSEFNFSECRFVGCDLSMANLMKTAFQEVQFENCKLLGLHFEDCNPILLSFSFSDCLLDFSSFCKLNLKNVLFKNCKFREADFTETDLTGALFENCDLDRAIFAYTILEKADFQTAANFSIDPENNRISDAKFSTAGAMRLLGKYNIDIR